MLSVSGSMTMTAPAKVNLALHIVGRRDDGYHLIESLTVFAEDGDVLTAAPAETDGIVVAGRYAAHVPIDGANLVVQARDAMRARFGPAANKRVALRLEKNLPVASGIGGGSSDAATTMRLLQRFWGLGEEKDSVLADVGLSLGADVPMCLAATPLVARGVGEEIEPLSRFPPLALVLVNPGVPLATATVFGRLAERNNPAMPVMAPDDDPGAIIDWLAATRNDLQAPASAMVPEIEDALSALRASGASLARMSGSGATCFGIYEKQRAAEKAAAELAAAKPAWFVRATPTRAKEHRE